MTTQREYDLLRERSADGVVRGWGKGEEKSHTPERENQPPRVEKCVLVADNLAEDRAESNMQGPFFNLTKSEALCQLLDGRGVRSGVSSPLLCKYLRAHATRTSTPLAVSFGSPSNSK